VVSITDLDDTSCATSVDGKAGAGGAACRTFLIHGGGVPVGDTLDHRTTLLITHGLIFRLLVRGEPGARQDCEMSSHGPRPGG